MTTVVDDQVSARLAYSPQQAAEALGIGRTLIYQLIDSGSLRSLKIGRRRLIPRDAIVELLADGGAE